MARPLWTGCFDNTVEDGITRAAFNREFLAASGRPWTDTTVRAFSWPSLGKIVSFPVPDADYRHDQKMATLSGVHLMNFFAQIEPLLRMARANGCRRYLLAHSMGNLALQSAVEHWFLHGNGNAELFNVSILAAADCGLVRMAQKTVRIRQRFRRPLIECSTHLVLVTAIQTFLRPTNIIACLPLCAMR
jgi:esterase/lipase superfamily enzyme